MTRGYDMSPDSKPSIQDKKKAIEDSPVCGKTIVVEVRDHRFAAALYAVGVPFSDPKKPMTVMAFADGTRKEVWRFAAMSEDGKINTQKLIKAAADPAKWLSENRDHPFAYCLSTMLNLPKFEEASLNRRALVGFKLKGERVIYVYEDSRKHRRLIDMKAVQI